MLKRDPRHAGNQSNQFPLFVLQRCRASLGIVRNLERTQDGVNRVVLQMPT